jgi:hypothetical protein
MKWLTYVLGTGTRIVIYNLRQENGELEFDFDEDPKDFILRGDFGDNQEKPPERNAKAVQKKRYRRDTSSGVDVELDYSLKVENFIEISQN